MHMEHTHYPLRVMQGYKIPSREAIEFCEMVRKAAKLAEIAGIDGVARARREVIPYGALVLERLLKRMQPRAVVFSVFGIREGLMFSLLPEHERRKDPLLSFCEDYAGCARAPSSTRANCAAWTDALFAPPGSEETDEDRRLRHAACLMSDIGWRAHPDYRGEQSLDIIAHAGLGGIDHKGRDLPRARRLSTGTPGVGEKRGRRAVERLAPIGPSALQKRARIVGAAIRAAHMLSIGSRGVIDETPLSYEGDRLVLTIPTAYAGLDGERLRRRFDVLASLLGKREPKFGIARRADAPSGSRDLSRTAAKTCDGDCARRRCKG